MEGGRGAGVPGYADVDAAFRFMTAAGIEEAMLYERRPLTVPAVEKVIGKAQYKQLVDAGHVKMVPGKPTLALESDKREPITRSSALDDFRNEMGGNEQ